MSAARARLGFAQTSFLVVAVLMAFAAYSALTRIVTVDQQYIDGPDADLVFPSMWHFDLGRALRNITDIEDMQ